MKRAILIFMAFVLSSIALSAQTIVWPFGKADFQTASIAADSTASIEITNTMTYLLLDTLTAHTTLNLDITKKIRPGSILIVEANSSATAKNLICGDKLVCATVSGASNKGKLVSFIYDKTREQFLNYAVQQFN